MTTKRIRIRFDRTILPHISEVVYEGESPYTDDKVFLCHEGVMNFLGRDRESFDMTISFKNPKKKGWTEVRKSVDSYCGNIFMGGHGINLTVSAKRVLSRIPSDVFWVKIV